MEILYSNILPIGLTGKQQSIADTFLKELSHSDRIEIAVGYVSVASLLELDKLIEAQHIKNIILIMGMYYYDGMPEITYHTAMDINMKWQKAGIGEIRMVYPFKYHGKVVCFYSNGQPVAAIVGSANLGVLKLDASNRRQYELSVITHESNEVWGIAEHINSLKAPKCSKKINELDNIPLVRERNTALDNIELVEPISKNTFDYYKRQEPVVRFYLPIKVPKASERFLDDGKHFTKSNINVCYAAPRSRRKARDWYETQLTVSADIYRLPGYPEKGKPFFIITDDGYSFLAHTTSDNNKQFSAVGDELIMGRWLKGRLAAAGIVQHINNTAEDTGRLGMITREMLDKYGCDRLLFEKTGKTTKDDKGNNLDVWLLSFTNDEA